MYGIGERKVSSLVEFSSVVEKNIASHMLPVHTPFYCNDRQEGNWEGNSVALQEVPLLTCKSTPAQDRAIAGSSNSRSRWRVNVCGGLCG